MYEMVFKRRSQTQAFLYLSWIKKTILLLVALFLFVVALSDLPRILWIAFFLALVSLAAGLYRESWCFIRSETDPGSLTLTSYIGMWPLRKKRVYPIGKAISIRVSTPNNFIQKHMACEARSWGYHRLAHSFDKSISRVELVARDEEKIILYADTTRKERRLIALADQIASFLNVRREILEQ